jgi:hypothetical protein
VGTLPHIIDFPPDRNPEFMALWAEAGRLVSEADALAVQLNKLSPPRLRTRKALARVIDIGRRISSFGSSFLKWEGAVRDFLIRPILRFGPGTDRLHGYLHLTSLLQEELHYLRMINTQLLEGHRTRYVEVENRENFLIAITAALLSLAGLVIGIIQACTPT